MAFEQNMTVLELFLRTIHKYYKHLVAVGELEHYPDQQLGHITKDQLNSIYRGDPTKIMNLMMNKSEIPHFFGGVIEVCNKKHMSKFSSKNLERVEA